MRRALIEPVEPASVKGVPAGSRLKSFHEQGAEHRRDFLLMRRQGQEPVKLSMPHVKVFKALWRMWLKKRLNDKDFSSTALEIQTETNLAGSTINSALESMTRNGMVRKTEENIGWRGKRNRYTPTQSGVELLALAEYLGDGSLVQVGRKATEWVAPGGGEPPNLFDFAKLLTGGKTYAED